MTPQPETALAFGSDARLLGLLNHRTGDAPVACVLMNVGVTQRIGPRRLNVKLARALGAAGIASLRFDLSGIGDSAHAPAPGAYEVQAADDVGRAMDAVEAATGIRQFMLLGICSGAVNGYRVAQRDARVVGLLMFDGYAYPNLKTRLIHDWTRLRSTPLPEIAAKLKRRALRLFGAGQDDAKVSIFFASRDATAPDSAAYARALDALMKRGVDVFVMYSASLLSLYNHHSQFRDVFRGHAFVDRVRCVYAPALDHIPTSQAAQRQFLGEVVGWAKDCIGRRSGAR